MLRRTLLLALLFAALVLLPTRLRADTPAAAHILDAYGRPLRPHLDPARYAGPARPPRATADAPQPTAVDNWRGWSAAVYMQWQANGWHVIVSRDGTQRDLTPSGGLQVEPDIARGGDKILFSTRVGDTLDVIRANADGSARRLLTNSSHDESWARWSPDGRQIAYESYAFGAPEIYVMHEDGRNQRRLTNSPAFDGWPTWSPDGTRIAWASTSGGSFGIWLMNADGSAQTRIIDLPFSTYPAWSPDGRYIAFSAAPGGSQWLSVYVYDVVTSDLRALTPPNDVIDHLVSGWTPDGKAITYTEVNYVLSGGRYYWQSTLPKWSALTMDAGGLLDFGPFSDTIWHPRLQTRDVTPPTLTLQAPVGDLLPVPQTLHWTSDADVGPPPNSSLIGFQLQTRVAGQPWPAADVVTTLPASTLSYPLAHPPGVPTDYRLRAVDEALNFSAWQALPNPITLYRSVFNARVTDHTGVPVQGATLTSVPAALRGGATDGDGRLRALLASDPPVVETTWAAAAYGPLPPQRWPGSGLLPVERHVVLPPADNVLPDGQFDGSLGAWQPVGSGTPPTLIDSAYSGSGALRFGTPTATFATPQWQPVAPVIGRLARMATAVTTADGRLHAVFALNSSDGTLGLLHATRAADGRWQPAVNLPLPPDSRGWIANLQLLPSPDGRLALVYSRSAQIFYAAQAADGTWLPATHVLTAEANAPLVRAAYAGQTLVVVCAFEEADGWFTWGVVARARAADGTWLPPETITGGQRGILRLMLDAEGDGTLHALLADDINARYARRSAAGAWSALQMFPSFLTDGTLMRSADGQLHLVGLYNNALYVATRGAAGWSTVRRVWSGAGLGDFWAQTGGAHNGTLVVIMTNLGVTETYSLTSTDGVTWVFTPLAIGPLQAFAERDVLLRSNGGGGVLATILMADGRYVTVNLTGGGAALLGSHAQPALATDDGDVILWRAQVDGDGQLAFSQPLNAPLPPAAGVQHSVTLPATLPNPTLSLLLRQPGASAGADLGLDVLVQPAGGALVRLAALREPLGDWSLVNVDLGAYAGQTVTLRLQPQTSPRLPLAIDVDALALGAARPDLWLTAQAPAVVAPGETLTLTVQVGNRGFVAAPAARLTLTLPAGLTLLAADPPPTTGTRWELGTLPAAAAQTLTLQLRAGAAGDARPRNITLALAGALAETETANNQRSQPLLVGYRQLVPALMRR